jgi:hypothetical protein
MESSPLSPHLQNARADRLRHLFLDTFSAMDVAEALVSFDAGAPAAEVAAFLDGRGWDLVGVRENGLVTGFALRAELGAGALGAGLRRFGPDDVVPHTASLADAIASLDANGRCFVEILGRVGGIVTLRDLEKPAVRMWLFGLISIIEMGVTQRIRELHRDGSWIGLLSPARRAKAEELLAERRRRGLADDLLECTQLADKAAILARDPVFLSRNAFPSRRQASIAFQRLQALRNALVHTNTEIVASDFQAVVALARKIDDLVRAIPGASPAT